MTKQQERLEDLDLSKLTEQERRILELHLNRSSVAWLMALICAGLSAIALYLALQSGVADREATLALVIKILGFVGLGYWARGWSRLAAVFLLGWHLWLNHQYLGADRFQLKLHFWVPTLVFVWAALQAMVRASILRKARGE